MFTLDETAKMMKVRYLIIDVISSYNKIIELYAFNLLGASLTTSYLCMKYPLPNGFVGVIQGDQKTPGASIRTT